MAERVADEGLPSRASRQRTVERELEPRQAMVVDAGIAEHLRRDRVLRVEPPLFRIEPEACDVQALELRGTRRVGLAGDVDEAVRTVG